MGGVVSGAGSVLEEAGGPVFCGGALGYQPVGGAWCTSAERRVSCDQVSALATVGHLVGGFTEHECWARQQSPVEPCAGCVRSLWWGRAAGPGGG